MQQQQHIVIVVVVDDKACKSNLKKSKKLAKKTNYKERCRSVGKIDRRERERE